MRRLIALALLVVAPVSGLAQSRGRRATPPPPPATKTIAPDVTCPTPLGVGVKSKVAFCEVMAGTDPAQGVLIQVPPHKGYATLTFNLHNLHTYSEEQIRAKRAFTRYTATIGLLTMDNTLISRAVVQSEFRAATDLVDRVGGGAGPGGVKAVAPTGSEAITISIPEGEPTVSLLGETLTVERLDGLATYKQAGRPIAVVSNLMLEYRPGPPPKPTAKGRQGRQGR